MVEYGMSFWKKELSWELNQKLYYVLIVLIELSNNEKVLQKFETLADSGKSDFQIISQKKRVDCGGSKLSGGRISPVLPNMPMKQ